MLQRWGVDVIALGPSLDDDDSYYLIRLYASLEERQRSQDAFYGTNTTSSTCQRRVITSF